LGLALAVSGFFSLTGSIVAGLQIILFIVGFLEHQDHFNCLTRT
jgi:hypothetical protein